MAQKRKPATDREPEEPKYGQAMERLQQLLERLENEEVDVDDLGSTVAEASRLIELCRTKIQAAEVQVEEIVQKFEQAEAPPEEGEGKDIPF